MLGVGQKQKNLLKIRHQGMNYSVRDYSFHRKRWSYTLENIIFCPGKHHLLPWKTWCFALENMVFS